MHARDNQKVAIYLWKPPHNRYQYWVKSARIPSFFGSYFPAFGLNTETYGVFFCI